MDVSGFYYKRDTTDKKTVMILIKNNRESIPKSEFGNEKYSFFIIRRIGFCGLFPSNGFFSRSSFHRCAFFQEFTHPPSFHYGVTGRKQNDESEEQILKEIHERVQGLLEDYIAKKKIEG